MQILISTAIAAMQLWCYLIEVAMY